MTRGRDPLLPAALALIALATLTPGAGPGGGGPEWPPNPADLLVNFCLYLPLGIAMRRRGASALAALAVGASLSGVVEALQFQIIPGRDSSLADLIANTAGAWAGAMLPARMLLLPLSAVWLASHSLLAPVPLPSEAWFGQWTRATRGTTPYPGRVEAVYYNGAYARDDILSVATTNSMRLGYDDRRIDLVVEIADPPGPLRGRAHIASIADRQRGHAIGLWQHDAALEVNWYARGTRIGLRQPAVQSPVRVRLAEGQPGRVLVQISRGSILVAPDTEDHPDRYETALGPWQGWRLFWPLRAPRPGVSAVISVLWTLACLAVPVGAWVWHLVRTGRRKRPGSA